MTEHREETILGQTCSFRLGVRFARRFIKSGVVDGKSGALGQFLGERELVGAARARGSINHGDGSEHAIVCRQRDGNERANAHSLDRLAVRRVGKQIANIVEGSNINHRIGPRRPA